MNYFCHQKEKTFLLQKKTYFLFYSSLMTLVNAWLFADGWTGRIQEYASFSSFMVVIPYLRLCPFTESFEDSWSHACDPSYAQGWAQNVTAINRFRSVEMLAILLLILKRVKSIPTYLYFTQGINYYKWCLVN